MLLNEIKEYVGHAHRDHYPCLYCNLDFKKMTHWKGHLKKEHLIEHPFTCSFCKYKSIDALQMKSHVLTHAYKNVYRVPIAVNK